MAAWLGMVAQRVCTPLPFIPASRIDGESLPRGMRISSIRQEGQGFAPVNEQPVVIPNGMPLIPRRFTTVSRERIAPTNTPSITMPINGLITNDKCCLTRHGRLALTWPRSHPLPRAWRQDSAAYAPRDDSHRRGGRHASPARALMAPPSSAVSSPGRTAALGSSVSAPAAVDPASAPTPALDPAIARTGGQP